MVIKVITVYMAIKVGLLFFKYVLYVYEINKRQFFYQVSLEIKVTRDLTEKMVKKDMKAIMVSQV
jgi:hypothetical protein